MEGITVLHIINCTGVKPLYLIFLGASVVLLLTALILNAACVRKWIQGVTLVLAMMFVIAGVVLAVVPNGKQMYEVTIDDTVTLNEFYDKYEIVDKRDDIWKIKER